MFRPSVAVIALLASAPLVAQAGPKPLPRAQFIADMDAEFRKADADKDGQLTRVEIEQFQRATALAMAERRNQGLFARLDVDKNGQLSAAEFAKIPLNPPRVDASGLLSFDSSKDGKVSVVEHRSGTLTNFDRLDADKDGTLTVAEMKAGGIGK